MDPLLIVFGFGVGMLVGMTGMGGGSLMTPLLVLLFGVKPTLAVGTVALGGPPSGSLVVVFPGGGEPAYVGGPV